MSRFRSTIFLVAVACGLMSGCVSLQQKPTVSAIADGKAQLVVYRPDRFKAGGLDNTVFINDVSSGLVLAGYYRVIDVAETKNPTKVVLSWSEWIQKNNPVEFSPLELSINFEAGKRYYAKVATEVIGVRPAFLAFGPKYRYTFTLVPEAEALEGMNFLRKAED